MNEFPKQGEYIAINLSPTEGHEQQGLRPALVISKDFVNKRGMIAVLPITNTLQGVDRFILPSGEPVQGAVLFVQIRSLDWRARSFTSRGFASAEVLEEAISRFAAVIGR